MTAPVFLLTISLPLVTLLLIFGMKYYAAIQQARARLSHDDAYRQLAAQAASAQTQNNLALASIADTLAEVQTRLRVVEKILKEVE